MTNLILLLLCLIIGLLLQYVKNLPKDTHVALNVIILHVPLPALALLSIPNLEWELSLISLCLVSWIIFLLSYFVFRFIGKSNGWSDSVIGCLSLTAGLGNTAFVGFPMIEALYGKEAVKYGVFLDQPGTFLIVSSVGIYVAVLYSSGKLRKRDLAKKIISFPPFIGFIAAILLGVAGWSAQGDVKTLLERLASILTPLALISVGLQLKMSEMRHDLKYLSFGLGYKLFIAPLIIYSLYKLVGISGIIFKISVIEAAMAPMITAAILAQSYNLHPRLAGSMLGLGVPLSFVTVLLWYFIIG